MRNCGHIGRLGEYAERAADAAIILIATVNNGGAGQRVAPPGGIEPRVGTNPLCIALPTLSEDAPLVLDFGTSVAAEGKVRVHHISGQPAPDGWLLDSSGRPTNDPSVLYRSPPGSILPLGGEQSYKGFGLAVVLDLLAGGLSGGGCCRPAPPPVRGNNLFFLAIAPSSFSGSERLRADAGELAEYIRATPRVPGARSILLPGDPERAMLEDRTRLGVPIEFNHWQILIDLARRLNVALPATLES
jgi:uncharacterized oxidoreductase